MNKIFLAFKIRIDALKFITRLKAYSIEDRAYIRALAAFRYKYFPEIIHPDCLNILQKPTRYSKQECITLFEQLEQLRTQSFAARNQIAEIIATNEYSKLHSQYQYHSKMLDESFILWELSIVPGIIPSHKKLSQNIWQQFVLPESLIRQSIRNVKLIEHELSQASSQKDSLCEGLGEESWLELCNITPEY